MAALDGLRILDLTQYEAGTSCTQALAWLGADVVKIERPKSGDPGRGAFDEYGFADSEYFVNWNSNKRSVTLALDTTEGRDLLLRMASHYDVFIENFGPGVVEKLDLGYDVLRSVHPTIIYGRIKGFGASGPYAHYKCFDSVAQAAGGAMSLTGEAGGPPMRPGVTVGDSGTGVQMALALCAAYVQRLRTGEGQLVEISMQEAVTYYLRTMIALGSNWGSKAAVRTGNGMGALINLFQCSPFGENDYVYIMAVTPQMWKALATTIGRKDLLSDERYSTARSRLEHGDELHEIVEGWTRTKTKREAMETLSEAGVPASAVYDTLDLFNDGHLRERGFVHEIQHETAGDVRILGWPARLSKSDVPIEASPTLGRDTLSVLSQDLGLSGDELAELTRRGIVGDESAALKKLDGAASEEE